MSIFSLSFSFNDNWLSCIGDSGTLHIFSVNAGKREFSNTKKTTKNSSTKNNKSLLGKLGLGAILKYFDSELNFAHYRNNYDFLTKAFFLDNEDQVLLVSYGGDCCKLSFDHEYGGECQKRTVANLLTQKE